MVGIALKDRAQTILAHQIAVLALNRENDVRTKMIAGCIFNRKFAFAVAFPLCSGIGRITGFTGNNGYFVDDDKGRIKTDTKLSDKLRVFLLISG